MQNTMVAPPLENMANLLEDQGRYGDTELVHMSQPEVRGLQSLGRLTRNPETGLMEAFSIGGFFKDYVAPAALFAVPYVGPYLSAGYTGIKAGLESGNVLTGITSGLLSYGLGKVGQNIFKGAFGADKAISPGAKSFTSSLEKGATGAKVLQQTGGTNFGQAPISGQNIKSALDVANTGIQNVPISARITPAFNNAAPSVPGNPFKQFAKTLSMPGGGRQLGGEFMKNLMTPETAIRGLASGVVSDLTRTPEYAEATGFATDDSAKEPDLKKNRNFAMNTRTAPFDQARANAAFIPDSSGRVQPLEFTDPSYSPAVTGNVSSTFLAKKGGMLDALDSITEGMEELAEQTDGDVSIEGMIKAAQEGGLMGMQPYEGRVIGQGNGMSDEIPFSIEGQQPALLSRDEYVIPSDVVSALGSGSSNAGADKLDVFLTNVRKKVMGRERQINQIG